MVKAKFIEKAPKPHPDSTPEVPTPAVPDELERFHFPELTDAQAKAFVDITRFTPNNGRFDLEFRDRVIVSTVTRRIDKSAGKLMEIILKLVFADRPMAASRTVNLVDIHSEVRECLTDMNLIKFKDHYLKVLEEDRTRFVDRVGDEGGGTFVVNYKHIFQSLAAATVENVVKEKFGSKALRIFKYVRFPDFIQTFREYFPFPIFSVIKAKGYVEESQIQRLVMVPTKETKLLTYELLETNFIQLQELRKSMAANAVSKSFYLFYVDLRQVARLVLEMCYKATNNALVRRNHEMDSNARLLERQVRFIGFYWSLKYYDHAFVAISGSN